MMKWLGPRNAVAYGWFHARGGWFMHGLIVSIVLAALGLLLAMTAYSGGGRSAFAGWAVASLAGLGALSLLVGALGIVNAIRADAGSGSGGMHESLRLMRAAPGAVVLGYITGAGSQMWCVVIPCVAAGVTASVLADIEVLRWLWGAMLLMTTVLTALVAATLLGFMARQPGILIVVLVGLTPVSLALLTVVPGLTLLAGPAAGAGVLDLRSAEIRPELVLSVLVQAALATVCFLAAARKFRDPAAMAFNVDLGLALLVVWAGANLLGILNWELIRPDWMSGSARLELHHAVGAGLPAVVVALVPVLAAGRRLGETLARARWLPGGALAGADAWRPLLAAVLLPPVLVILPAAALIAVLPGTTPDAPARIILAAVSVMLTGLTLPPAAALAHAAAPAAARWIVGCGAAVLLLGPMIVDLLLLWGWPSGDDRIPFRILSGVSPLGQLLLLFSGGEVIWAPVVVGVVVQLVLALAAIGALRRLWRRQPRFNSPPPTRPPPPSLPPRSLPPVPPGQAA